MNEIYNQSSYFCVCISERPIDLKKLCEKSVALTYKYFVSLYCKECILLLRYTLHTTHLSTGPNFVIDNKVESVGSVS